MQLMLNVAHYAIASQSSTVLSMQFMLPPESHIVQKATKLSTGAVEYVVRFWSECRPEHRDLIRKARYEQACMIPSKLKCS